MAYEFMGLWRSPLPLSHDLLAFTDTPYHASSFDQRRGDGAKCWNRPTDENFDIITSDVLYWAITDAVNFFYNEPLVWSALGVTIGELAFIFARNNSALCDMDLYFGAQPMRVWVSDITTVVASPQERLAWATLLKGAGIRGTFDARKLIRTVVSAGLGFDDVSHLITKGITSPKMLIAAHANGIDANLINAL